MARRLAELVGTEIALATDSVGDEVARLVHALSPGQIVLLENVRFHPEEERNDPLFAKALAAPFELYVNDAFGAAHRAHASTEGVARILPAYAGLLLERELEALGALLHRPARPFLAIVGGAKVSSKLAVLHALLERVDTIAIGGGMANTFLHAKGIAIGRSLSERDMADTARRIMEQAEASKKRIVLPIDAVVAPALTAGDAAKTVPIGRVPEDQMILDIGTKSIADTITAVEGCRTLVWNGPLGAFEYPPFDKGTVAVAKAAARLTKAGSLLSVAGGGDTVAALAQAGVEQQFSYVSAAGGAFLEWLEGKELPGVAALAKR